MIIMIIMMIMMMIIIIIIIIITIIIIIIIIISLCGSTAEPGCPAASSSGGLATPGSRCLAANLDLHFWLPKLCLGYLD